MVAYIKPTIQVITLAPEHLMCTSIKISDEEVDAGESFANQREYSSPFDGTEQEW